MRIAFAVACAAALSAAAAPARPVMPPMDAAAIAGGYAAGYCGYMWSEVLALDMLSAFKCSLLDASVGRRYRDTILAQGGQEEPQKLVRRFLGREPDSKAFFEEITGKR